MTNRPSSRRLAPAAVVEALEGRRLLAVYLSNGTLFVDGTSGDDEFWLTYTDAEHGDGKVVAAGVNSTHREYAPSAIQRVSLRGFGGRDGFDIREYSGTGVPPATVDGGDGNDWFVVESNDADLVRILGGAGNDHVFTEYTRLYCTFDGGSGIDKMSGDLDDYLDLRLHPNVENATLIGGTLIGNSLANSLNIEMPSSKIYGLGGNDTLRAGGYGGTLLDGGDGNDSLTMENGGDRATLRGGAGNDRLVSLSNGYTDLRTLEGGDGNDTLTGGTGPELFKGGGGTGDVLDYRTRTGGVRVSLSTSANDGASNGAEGDNAWYDLEQVWGGGGSDFILGTGSNNVLRGNAGNDTLLGGGGSDALFGGSGNDSMDGGSSNDYLEGGTGNDKLIGGSGADTLYGGDGDDWLYGRDGTRDTLSGGSGYDRAQRDRDLDYVSSISVFLA